MKTLAERDRIDTRIYMERTDITRHRKLLLLLEYQGKHGCVDGELLEAFGKAEWSRGFDAGVRDAIG